MHFGLPCPVQTTATYIDQAVWTDVLNQMSTDQAVLPDLLRQDQKTHLPVWICCCPCMNPCFDLIQIRVYTLPGHPPIGVPYWVHHTVVCHAELR